MINFRILKWEECPWSLRWGQWKVRERRMTMEAGDIERLEDAMLLALKLEKGTMS